MPIELRMPELFLYKALVTAERPAQLHMLCTPDTSAPEPSMPATPLNLSHGSERGSSCQIRQRCLYILLVRATAFGQRFFACGKIVLLSLPALFSKAPD
jgi:hypothetical protein